MEKIFFVEIFDTSNLSRTAGGLTNNVLFSIVIEMRLFLCCPYYISRVTPVNCRFCLFLGGIFLYFIPSLSELGRVTSPSSSSLDPE